MQPEPKVHSSFTEKGNHEVSRRTCSAVNLGDERCYWLAVRGMTLVNGIYVSYCFISINNRLLVVKCYSSLVVSGFSRNEFNSYILFNFCCCFYLFLFDVKIKGD